VSFKDVRHQCQKHVCRIPNTVLLAAVYADRPVSNWLACGRFRATVILDLPETMSADRHTEVRNVQNKNTNIAVLKSGVQRIQLNVELEK